MAELTVEAISAQGSQLLCRSTRIEQSSGLKLALIGLQFCMHCSPWVKAAAAICNVCLPPVQAIIMLPATHWTYVGHIALTAHHRQCALSKEDHVPSAWTSAVAAAAMHDGCSRGQAPATAARVVGVGCSKSCHHVSRDKGL